VFEDFIFEGITKYEIFEGEIYVGKIYSRHLHGRKSILDDIIKNFELISEIDYPFNDTQTLQVFRYPRVLIRNIIFTKLYETKNSSAKTE